MSNSKMLYRIYSADNSKHYTVVQCKDGSFLEVKNPDNNNTKSKFETLEDWCKNHNVTVEDVKTEEEKPKEKAAVTEINITDPNFQYGYWLYNKILKFDKKLLKNPEFITAFNNFHSIYDKYKEKMYTSEWQLKNSPEKYNPKWITFTDKDKQYDGTERETQLGGLSWSFKPIYYGTDVELKKAREEEEKQISSEIKAAFKTLCELLAPTLRPKLENKYETNKTKSIIAQTNRYLKKCDNHIRKVMNNIEGKMRHIRYLESDIESYNKKKEECQQKIEEAKARIAKFEKKNSNE